MSGNPGSSHRIKVLDGFRFLAIVSVLLYHFYSRWTTPIVSHNLYPYGAQANFFRLGFLGVQFFFLISGFVISYTLCHTHSLGEFWKKRFIRLFPAMLICSVITVLVLNLLDTQMLFPMGHRPANILMGLTFLGPYFVNTLLKPFGWELNYVTGSYWSLWPEIQFYFLAGIIYFLKPKLFFRNFFIAATGLYLLTQVLFYFQAHLPSILLPLSHLIDLGVKLTDMFNLSHFILWFLLGAVFFQLFSRQDSNWTKPALFLILCLQFYDCKEWDVRMLFLCMITLFLLLIYLPQSLKFLENKSISTAGFVSYSVYLIHENVGVLFINKYAGLMGQFAVCFPILLILLIFVFAQLLARYVEKPLTTRFKHRWLKTP